MNVVLYYLRMLCMPPADMPTWARKRRVRVIVLIFCAASVAVYGALGVAPAVTLATITGVVATAAVVSKYVLSGKAPEVAL
jgi:hypothetical protein